MRLTPEDARARFAAAPVARLATVGSEGAPHLVPITFAVDGDLVCFAVDHKPKSTRDLRRLRNIRANDQVSRLQPPERCQVAQWAANRHRTSEHQQGRWHLPARQRQRSNGRLCFRHS